MTVTLQLESLLIYGAETRKSCRQTDRQTDRVTESTSIPWLVLGPSTGDKSKLAFRYV